MLLTEIENKVLNYLRNPTFSVNEIMRGENRSPVDDLSNVEIVTLYNKMDSVIEKEGNTRRALGDFDEMYVLELLGVKDKLLKECNNRGLNISTN